MQRTRQSDIKDPVCPYCEFKLQCLPDKPGICPQCRNKVYVHFKQRIIDRILLTKTQAQVVGEFIKLSRETGITEADYHEKFKELATRNEYPPEPQDVLRALKFGDEADEILMDVMQTHLTDSDGSVMNDEGSVFEAEGSILDHIQEEAEELEKKSEPQDTVDQAGTEMEAIDEKPIKTRKTDLQYFLKESMRLLKALGIQSSDTSRVYKQIKSTLDREPSAAEVTFRLFQRTLELPQDHHQLSADHYLQLARLFHSYGLRCFSIHQAWAKHRIKALHEAGYDKVELVALTGHKGQASQWDGQIVPIDLLLKLPPLPDRNLVSFTRPDDQIGWCECDYLPVDEPVHLEPEMDIVFDELLSGSVSSNSGLMDDEEPPKN